MAFTASACDDDLFDEFDDSQVPDALREAYWEDAGRLAARSVLKAGGSAAESVELPIDAIDRFYTALILLHNSSSYGRYQVVDVYEIHARARPETHRVFLQLLRPAWADPWRRGERLTGYPPVDTPMEAYDLQLDDFRTSPSLGEIATLYSAAHINTPALAALFAGVDRIGYAGYGNGSIGGGDDIEARAMDGYVELDFSVGYGDCPSGCIYRHYWMFRAHADGRVVYRGERGDGAPPSGRRY
jgi:hypothetical protein